MQATHDLRGCALTGASPAALVHYEDALSLFLCHRGDPLAAARRAQLAAPAFTSAFQLEAWLLACTRDPRDRPAAHRAHRSACRLARNERERAHAAALASLLARDYPRAFRHLRTIEALWPRDVLALAAANTFDLYLGEGGAPAQRMHRAFAHWARGMPGYHAVLAMRAFALEEIGEYGRAEEAAHCALEDEPHDLRAHHAIAHVHEMRGDPDAGIRWMGERASRWDTGGGAAVHQWWHVALYHLQREDTAHALRIYDHRIAPRGGLSALIDASALLWRLQLAGAEAPARWSALAERWAPYAADGFCGFNDLHAMMAFAGAGREDLAAALLAAQARAAARPGPLGAMSRLVAWPACRALHAFGRGDYATAQQALRALPPVAHRIGGSHAQRDILALTLQRARMLQSLRATRPARTMRAPTRRRPSRPSFSSTAPMSAAKITEVSRSAATMATGARVIAQSAIP